MSPLPLPSADTKRLTPPVLDEAFAALNFATDALDAAFRRLGSQRRMQLVSFWPYVSTSGLISYIETLERCTGDRDAGTDLFRAFDEGEPTEVMPVVVRLLAAAKSLHQADVQAPQLVEVATSEAARWAMTAGVDTPEVTLVAGSLSLTEARSVIATSRPARRRAGAQPTRTLRGVDPDRWARATPLLDALRSYRQARQTLLAGLGLAGSNRDPLAEVSEHLVAALLDGTLASSRVQKGWDLTDPDGRRVQVRYLANPAGAWVNEHLVDFRSSDVDRYALVIFENLEPKSVLLFERAGLAEVGDALGKRHGSRDVTLQLTARNYRQLTADAARFARYGVEVVTVPM